MENKDTVIRLLVGVIIIMALFTIAFNKPHDQIAPPPANHVCEDDSLRSVIYDLKSNIEILEDGFDSKERRYEDVISDYEMGLSYLKDYHPNAYKDFHRIIGMREHYSLKLEKENKEKLQIGKY